MTVHAEPAADAIGVPLVALVTGSRTVDYAVAAVRAYAKADLLADVFAGPVPHGWC